MSQAGPLEHDALIQQLIEQLKTLEKGQKLFTDAEHRLDEVLSAASRSLELGELMREKLDGMPAELTQKFESLYASLQQSLQRYHEDVADLYAEYRTLGQQLASEGALERLQGVYERLGTIREQLNAAVSEQFHQVTQTITEVASQASNTAQQVTAAIAATVKQLQKDVAEQVSALPPFVQKVVDAQMGKAAAEISRTIEQNTASLRSVGEVIERQRTIEQGIKTIVEVHTARYRDIIQRLDASDKSAERRHDDIVHIANRSDDLESRTKALQQHTEKIASGMAMLVRAMGERLDNLEKEQAALAQKIEQTVASKISPLTKTLYIAAGAAVLAVLLLLYALSG